MTDETKELPPWEKPLEGSQPPVTSEQPPVVTGPEAPATPPVEKEGPKVVPTQLGAAKQPNPITDMVAGSEEPGEEEVTVTVPKAFKLRIDHHQVYEIKAGIQPMKKHLAESWYAKANGVVIYQPK